MTVGPIQVILFGFDRIDQFRGQIVESASAEAIYENPQHEYTRKLLAAVPEFE